MLIKMKTRIYAAPAAKGLIKQLLPYGFTWQQLLPYGFGQNHKDKTWAFMENNCIPFSS